MNLVTRFLSLAERARALVPGAVAVEPLDLDRDWPDIEALLAREEWPFVRADLELGHAQPGHTSFVARQGGRFAAFFTTHCFGDVGYLDMMVVHPDFRGATVARPLYLRTLEALDQQGARGLVVHTTNDSARLIGLLGFQPGRAFTLRIRPPGPSAPGPALQPADPAQLAAHDTAVFGRARPAWTGWLATDPRVHRVALGSAACVLRPRANEAWSLDQIFAPDPEALGPLVHGIVAAHGHERPLMAFAATGGPLDAALTTHGFTVPDFFVPIGPLVEWRQGQTAGVGDGEGVHSLLWL